MYIWGHSYEFDRKDNWEHIEEICKKLSGNDEIWYATNIEIYDYVQAYKRLIYSADGHKIYNPTLFTIWLDVDMMKIKGAAERLLADIKDIPEEFQSAARERIAMGIIVLRQLQKKIMIPMVQPLYSRLGNIYCGLFYVSKYSII